MKTLEQIAQDYDIKNPNVSIVNAYTDGYIEAFRESIVKEQSRKINLERVYSFHQEAIKLIERAMKELE